jgi:hypothetical protein
VLVITGEGLKTLDAVRGTFETYEIDASVEAFESRVPEGPGVQERVPSAAGVAF